VRLIKPSPNNIAFLILCIVSLLSKWLICFSFFSSALRRAGF